MWAADYLSYSHVGVLPFPCVTDEVTSSPPKKKSARPRAQTGGKGAPLLPLGGWADESWGLRRGKGENGGLSLCWGNCVGGQWRQRPVITRPYDDIKVKTREVNRLLRVY